MIPDNERVNENDRKRYAVLRLIYQLSGANTQVAVSVQDIQNQLGFAPSETEWLLDYLEDEDLIKALGNERMYVNITHPGIIEFEQSVKNPARATDHFTTQVIQHFHGAVGAVQNAPQSTANVRQSVGIDAPSLVKLLEELRKSLNNLPADQREDALQLVDSLQEEAQSPTPRKERMKAFLKGLGSFALDTSSDVIASAISKSLGLSG